MKGVTSAHAADATKQARRGAPGFPLARPRRRTRGAARVAWLCADPGVPFGGTKGAAVHLRALTSAVARRGRDVLLLVAAAEPGAAPAPGVAVEVVRGPGAHAAERLAADAALARSLEQRLRAFGADVLYERLALHSAAGAHAARALGIPHVVELNAPLPWEAARYRGLRFPKAAERLERFTLSHAALVLAVSRPLAAYAAARGARRVAVLPNAASADVPLAVHDGPPVAVFAGTLRPWHGIEAIAGAWDLLARQAPPLLVVGDGPGAEQLERAGATVTGAVAPDAVPRLLARASIGLLPYAADGPRYFSPLKLFEYLAAGLAVVAGRLPGVEDLVDERSGVLIEPGDTRALARAVAALAADPGRRAALGGAGRALVTRHHTWDHRARTLTRAVDALVAARGAAA
jgi:glycosyltransferase involved in cell wall biosynthesis